ncbi:metallo-beta-lactamase family protein, partial [Listeria ivanovii FSL F6-596]
KRISMNWKLTDVDEKYHLLLNNSVLTYRDADEDANADVVLTTTRDTFNHIFSGVKSFKEAFADQSIKLEGNAEKFDEFSALLDEFSPVFNIVTP